ncbi:hypothetical protein ACS5PK_11225 [Roseateles sp. DB2]|uniref:hypothetical protein n=1 Tax=Roseateles sp. DB2 TaxID=3453717 RepID=UPI003EE90643
MKRLILLTVACPSVALAGGDYSAGTVSNFSGERGNYTFVITWDQPPARYEQCRQAKVEVRQERSPWYSWLPFVHSDHPTLEQTDQAASLLAAAQRSSKKVSFGYMGNGLPPADGQCQFKSKGLRVEHDSGGQFVLSYHDPV